MGVRKVTEEFNSVMNGKVEYRKKNSTWSAVLLLKARGLSHHLVGKRKTIEFSKPSYKIERHDSDDMRKKILDMTYTEWKSATRKLNHELRKRCPFHLG
ncbi:hypothetical protein [Methanococcoides sp. NM1]|uniref:hypothetical protein n=1 Tax=Methanococcoides sp. NM1 TaxID=1201013 RepID=UPI001FCE551C|nr:hypothetical protein [Methanococcoides sp. NM1]